MTQAEQAVRSVSAQMILAQARDRRISDDREEGQRLKFEARSRKLNDALRASRGDAAWLRDELAAARAELTDLAARVAARDRRLQAEAAACSAEARTLLARASPEKLEALQRFADGDFEGAYPVIEEITEAGIRARTVAANRISAAELRELARLRETMRAQGRGGVTAEVVLRLWDRAAALDGSDFSMHIERGRLAQMLGQLRRAVLAYRQAQELAGSERERSVVLHDLSDVLVAQGALCGARRQYEQSLAIAQRLAEQDRSSAQLQRDVIVSHWKLATLDNTRSAWERVHRLLQEMQAQGRLAPADQRFIAMALENAARAPSP